MPTTQDRLIRSARHCFELQGLRKTRMEDIAAHAQLSRATLYTYFQNKRDLIDHLALCEMVALNEQLRSRLRPSDGFCERLVEIIVVSVEIAQPSLYIRAMLADMDHLAGYPARNPKIYEWQIDQWQRFLNKAREREELAQDVDIPSAVRWITNCQLILFITFGNMETQKIPLRHFVQRFMVNPLLAHATPLPSKPPRGSEKILLSENAELRDVVASQALEIFQLRQQLAHA